MPSPRRFLLTLGTLAGLGTSLSTQASSPEAWATHKAEVVGKCTLASGLKNAKLVGELIEYDDRPLGAHGGLDRRRVPAATHAGSSGAQPVLVRQTHTHGVHCSGGHLEVAPEQGRLRSILLTMEAAEKETRKCA